jgi:hypothetical protein
VEKNKYEHRKNWPAALHVSIKMLHKLFFEKIFV